MTGRDVTFRFRTEDDPGPVWQDLARIHRPAYRRWFLREGLGPRPSPANCRKALRAHMPELAPLYDRVCDLMDGDDVAARFLSMYCPPAYVSGCSQAALETASGPVLIRNYDYCPRLLEGTVLHSTWGGKAVLASCDSLWGCLDGVNGDGVAISLAFGGREVVGEGFGIPLIVRYALEVSADLQDALEAVRSVPTHMAYNLTLVDRSGRSAMVALAPDAPAEVRDQPYAVNHQGDLSWRMYLRQARSLERAAALDEFIGNLAPASPPGEDELIAAFLAAPLKSSAYRGGFGTLYTALYRPATASLEMIWPHRAVGANEACRTAEDVQIGLLDGTRKAAPQAGADAGLSAH